MEKGIENREYGKGKEKSCFDCFLGFFNFFFSYEAENTQMFFYSEFRFDIFQFRFERPTLSMGPLEVMDL